MDTEDKNSDVEIKTIVGTSIDQVERCELANKLKQLPFIVLGSIIYFILSFLFIIGAHSFSFKDFINTTRGPKYIIGLPIATLFFGSLFVENLDGTATFGMMRFSVSRAENPIGYWVMQAAIGVAFLSGVYALILLLSHL